jgi:hypothetical protein
MDSQSRLERTDFVVVVDQPLQRTLYSKLDWPILRKKLLYFEEV